MDGQQLLHVIEGVYRQHELVDHLVAGVAKSGSRFILTEDIIKRLNYAAMNQVTSTPGAYRTGEVRINNAKHVPPSWIEVPAQMDTMCRYVTQNWDQRDLVHLAAFVLWRLNWIHPFQDGNGRTSRAAAYLIMQARFGRYLPPKNSVIEQITRNRQPYYDALRHADDVYDKTKDIAKAVEEPTLLLADLLKEQLKANIC